MHSITLSLYTVCLPTNLCFLSSAVHREHIPASHSDCALGVSQCPISHASVLMFFTCIPHTALSLQNRRNFLRILGDEAKARQMQSASCMRGEEHLKIPLRATCPSRSPRFRLYSPKIRKKFRLFCRLYCSLQCDEVILCKAAGF